MYKKKKTTVTNAGSQSKVQELKVLSIEERIFTFDINGNEIKKKSIVARQTCKMKATKGRSDFAVKKSIAS